jgi:hypothetical protein
MYGVYAPADNAVQRNDDMRQGQHWISRSMRIGPMTGYPLDNDFGGISGGVDRSRLCSNGSPQKVWMQMGGNNSTNDATQLTTPRQRERTRRMPFLTGLKYRQ